MHAPKTPEATTNATAEAADLTVAITDDPENQEAAAEPVAPEKPAKKKRGKKAADDPLAKPVREALNEILSVPVAAPGKKRGQKAKTKAAKPATSRPQGARVAKKRTGSTPTTMAGLADAYAAHLTEAKSAATALGYRMELQKAIAHFGAETPIGDLTPRKVQNYNTSPAVTQKKNGEPKDEKTINKTTRVFRLALVWAAEVGLIDEAPLPAKTDAE